MAGADAVVAGGGRFRARFHRALARQRSSGNGAEVLERLELRKRNSQGQPDPWAPRAARRKNRGGRTIPADGRSHAGIAAAQSSRSEYASGKGAPREGRARKSARLLCVVRKILAIGQRPAETVVDAGEAGLRSGFRREPSRLALVESRLDPQILQCVFVERPGISQKQKRALHRRVRDSALLQIFAMLLRGIERSRLQGVVQPDDCSLDRELAAPQHMAPMKQSQLAGVTAEPEGLAGVDRRYANAKAPGVRGADHARDLLA